MGSTVGHIVVLATLLAATPAVAAEGTRPGGERPIVPATTRAAPGTLVPVLPGVSLAVDFEEELFFADGRYWARRDGRWLRSQQPRSGFVKVSPDRVPPALRNLPPAPATGA